MKSLSIIFDLRRSERNAIERVSELAKDDERDEQPTRSVGFITRD